MAKKTVLKLKKKLNTKTVSKVLAYKIVETQCSEYIHENINLDKMYMDLSIEDSPSLVIEYHIAHIDYLRDFGDIVKQEEELSYEEDLAIREGRKPVDNFPYYRYILVMDNDGNMQECSADAVQVLPYVSLLLTEGFVESTTEFS